MSVFLVPVYGLCRQSFEVPSDRCFRLSLTRINALPVSRNWMARVVSGTRVPGIAQTLAELSRC